MNTPNNEVDRIVNKFKDAVSTVTVRKRSMRSVIGGGSGQIVNSNLSESVSSCSNNNGFSKTSQSNKMKEKQHGTTDDTSTLQRLLNHSCKALKVAEEKAIEWKEKYESAQMEIVKLQEELRQTRARLISPRMSVNSSRRKRGGYRVDRSSSGSRSRSGSRERSSGRSASPPRLSPIFCTPAPEPLSRSSHGRDRVIQRTPKKEERKSSKKKDESSSRRASASGENETKRLRSGSRHGSSSKRKSEDREGSKHRKGASNSLGTVKSEQNRDDEKVTKASPKKATRSSSSSSLKLHVSPGRNNEERPERSQSSTRGHKRRGSELEKGSGTPKKPHRSSTEKKKHSQPPILEKNAESEEEFDAFTLAQIDDEDSEELVDIDDMITPLPLTVASVSKPLALAPYKSTKSEIKPEPRSKASSLRPGANQPTLDKYWSSSSSSSKHHRGSTDSSISEKGDEKVKKSRKPKKDKQPSIHPLSVPAPSPRRPIKVEPESNSWYHFSGEANKSSFPPRVFDKKIDYTLYQKGEITSNVDAFSPNFFDKDVVKSPLSSRKYRGSTDSNKSSTKVSRKTKDGEERFVLTAKDEDNFLYSRLPYYFYESENNAQKAKVESGENDISKKIEEHVEVPRWRELIFPSYDPAEGKTGEQENLEDKTFLKRHLKSEQDEKRRKRWDAQRQREESYLEKLKKRNEERAMKKARRKRRRLQRQNDYDVETELDSFQPSHDKAVFINCTDELLPVTVFGYPLPYLEPGEFELPWEVNKLSSRSPLRTSTESSKPIAVNGKSFPKTVKRSSSSKR